MIALILFLRGLRISSSSSVEHVLYPLIPRGKLATCKIGLVDLTVLDKLPYITTLLFDKTGTLTFDKFCATQLYIQGKFHQNFDDVKKTSKEFLDLLASAVCVTTSYSAEVHERFQGDLNPRYVGVKIGCAMLRMLKSLDFSYERIRKQYPEDTFICSEYRRYNAVVVLLEDGIKRLFVQDYGCDILDKCSRIISNDLETQSLDKDKLDEISAEWDLDNGLYKVVAYRDLELNENLDTENLFSSVRDMTCIAIIKLDDPLRPQATEVVERCVNVGIDVKMITGDSKTRAESIASQCGIWSSKHTAKLVLEGSEFESQIQDDEGDIDHEKMSSLAGKLAVLYRSSPDEKYVLVQGLKQCPVGTTGKRRVVAVVGDGTNDALALAESDVAFVMGEEGTDAAKSTAQVMLEDDNLQSVVTAIVLARGIYDNVTKCINFHFINAFTVALYSLVSACLESVAYIGILSLLWALCTSNVLLTLGFSVKGGGIDYLQKPLEFRPSLISAGVRSALLIQGVLQLAVLLGLSLSSFASKDILVLNTVVFMQLANYANLKLMNGNLEVTKICKSHRACFIVIIAVMAVHVLFVELGLYVGLLGTDGISVRSWLLSAVCGLISLLCSRMLSVIFKSAV